MSIIGTRPPLISETNLYELHHKEAVEKVLTEQKPDVVVHCAAWTAVDLAEDDDKVEKVRAINAGGTENIAKVCKTLDAQMVYTSTDYGKPILSIYRPRSEETESTWRY